MGGSEVGPVAGEDLDPLLAGVFEGLSDKVRSVAVTASGHGHVRRGGTGVLPDGDVGVVDGLALGAVDRGGVGQLHVPGRVVGGDLALTHTTTTTGTSVAVRVEGEAARAADVGDGPGLSVRDLEVGVVSAGRDAVPDPEHWS